MKLPIFRLPRKHSLSYKGSPIPDIKIFLKYLIYTMNISYIEQKFGFQIIFEFRFGYLEHWQRGDSQENYSYDKNGRLVTINHSNTTFLAFQYKDRQPLPHKVCFLSGADLRGNKRGFFRPGGL